MTAAEPFRRLTRAAYNALFGLSKTNPELWTDPEADFEAHLGAAFCDPVPGVHLARPVRLRVDEELKQKKRTLPRADQQAWGFYQSLEGMTPASADDPLVWAWASHFWCHRFTLERFPPTPRAEKSREALAKWVQSHWFYESGTRPLYMNIPARLWWLAHLSDRAARASRGVFSGGEAVRHFSEHPQRFHTIIYYPVLWERRVLAEFVRLSMKEAAGANKQGFETIAKHINLGAGTRLLGVMPQPELRRMFQQTARRVLSDPANAGNRRAVHNPKKLRVLSLGAGVQSSVLALMCEREDYKLEKPDFAVFADTGWEPPEVYDHLEWLQSQLSYEVVRVSAGNLRDDLLSDRSADGYTFLGIPCYVVNPDGSSSVLKRQCTHHYKLRPIYREIRRRLGLEPGRRAPKNIEVEMWLGISSDEAERMKPGLHEYTVNKYPLVDRGFTRSQLKGWFTFNYPDRTLPRSACIGCPYHSNAVWADMKENRPELFANAVAVDRALRNGQAGSRVLGEPYLHNSRTPLEQADLSTPAPAGFSSECEGMCAI